MQPRTPASNRITAKYMPLVSSNLSAVNYSVITPPEKQAIVISRGGMKKRLQFLAFCIAYFFIGCLYYGYSDTQLDHFSVLYFTCTSITTIGFGDVVPVTDQDKLFTIIYVSLGLYMVYNIIVPVITKLVESDLFANHENSLNFGEYPPLNDEDLEAAVQRKMNAYCFLVVGTACCGTLLISRLEKLTFVEGLFWVFQTVTTIGKAILIFFRLHISE